MRDTACFLNDIPVSQKHVSRIALVRLALHISKIAAQISAHSRFKDRPLTELFFFCCCPVRVLMGQVSTTAIASLIFAHLCLCDESPRGCPAGPVSTLFGVQDNSITH